MKLGRLIITIAKNTLIQSGGKFTSVLLGFITVAVLTRYLGAGGYGDFTLVFSYLAFFSVISDFGLQLAMVKEISGGRSESVSLYGTYFWLKLLLVILSTLVSIVFLIFFPYSTQLKLAIIVGAVAVSISGMMGYFNAIFQARIRLDILTLVDIITKFITVLTIILFVVWRMSFYAIVSSVLIGNLIGFLIALYILRDTITLHFDSSVIKKLVTLSIPIGITSFISTLYFKVDTIILSLYKSSSDVGVYSLAYKILENTIVFWGFYMASVYPLMAKFKYDNRKYFTLIKHSILIAIVGSIPLVVILFYFSPLIIKIFGGQSFKGAIESLRILIYSIPILFLNNIFYNFYTIERKNIVTAIAMSISLIANVWLNLIYIPLYGYIAASYITVLSALILLICYSIGTILHGKVMEL